METHSADDELSGDMTHSADNEEFYEVEIDPDNFYNDDYMQRTFKLVTKKAAEPKEHNLNLRYGCKATIGEGKTAEKCRWSFEKKAHFDRHALTHIPIGCFICQLCNTAAKYLYNMYDHWKKRCKPLCEDSERGKVMTQITLTKLKTLVYIRMVELGKGAEYAQHEGAIFVLNPKFMLTCVDKIKSIPEASCPCCNLSMLIVYKQFHSDVHLMKIRIDSKVSNVWFCNLCSTKFKTQADLYNHWRAHCPQMLAFGSCSSLSNMELASLAFNILQQSIPLEYYYNNAQIMKDRQKMIFTLRNQPAGRDAPDGKIYVYTAKLHPTIIQSPTNDDIFNNCVDLQSFSNMGWYNREKENSELSINRENALPKSSPFTITERGRWMDIQDPDGQGKRVFVFEADDTVLQSYGFNDRTLPRLSNDVNQKWNVQNKGEKCVYCDQVFSSKGRLNAHQNIHDEMNSCILCKIRFKSPSALHNHFKNSCEFTRRLLTAETRNRLDRCKVHLLLNAMNKVNLIFADDPRKVRYSVDVLADVIVIKKTCTTEVEADRVIDMCRIEISGAANCTEMSKNVEVPLQVEFSPPFAKRYPPHKQIVQNNQQLHAPIARKPVMQQFDSFHRTEPKLFYKQALAKQKKLEMEYNARQNAQQNQKMQQKKPNVVHRERLPIQKPTQQSFTKSFIVSKPPIGVIQHTKPYVLNSNNIASRATNMKTASLTRIVPNPNVIYQTVGVPKAVKHKINNERSGMVNNGHASKTQVVQKPTKVLNQNIPIKQTNEEYTRLFNNFKNKAIEREPEKYGHLQGFNFVVGDNPDIQSLDAFNVDLPKNPINAPADLVHMFTDYKNNAVANSVQLSVIKNATEIHNDCYWANLDDDIRTGDVDLKGQPVYKKTRYNFGQLPRKDHQETQKQWGMKIIDINAKREQSKLAFDPMTVVVEGDKLRIANLNLEKK